jgi:ubiquinone/menaquinone biosynthesis C-methylase UbiE
MEREILEEYKHFYEALVEAGRIEDDSDYRSVLSAFLLFAKRMKNYDFAATLCGGKKVLDIGCYTGYGETRLKNAREVVAVDSDDWALHIAGGRELPNASFAAVDARDLPFADGAFDVAITMHMLEHLGRRDLPRFLSEVARVLTPGGLFVTATPNRKIRLMPWERPNTPEHIREYASKNLGRVLELYFEDVQVMGVRAEDTVEKIEKQRVRPSALRAYIKSPARWLAASVLPPKTMVRLEREYGKRKKKVVSPLEAEKKFDTALRDFWMEDFYLVEEPREVDGAIDLYAIARKKGKDPA